MTSAVVIVNWNGAADTLACLASLAPASGADGDLRFIVVDNGSTDDSVSRLFEGMGRLGLRPRKGPAFVPGEDARALLVEAGENLGFAAGSNLGLRIAAAAGMAVTVFLNNDTIVEPGALRCMIDRLMNDPQWFATLPMILVHGTDHIWNCGGVIHPIGLRRYHLAGRPRAEGEQQGEMACSFFTGCCFAVRTHDFIAREGFSERFFFGEEDFELALWMRERGLRALCLTGAVVHHKVSAAFSQAAGPRAESKVFLYYLNRFIHMRLRLGWRWWPWLAAYAPYVAWLLVRSRTVSAAGVGRFLSALVGRARTMDRVTREDFQQVMAGQWR